MMTHLRATLSLLHTTHSNSSTNQQHHQSHAWVLVLQLPVPVLAAAVVCRVV